MRFEIKYTRIAVKHLRAYRKFEQKIILDTVDKQLQYEPTTKARNRKQLGENQLSTWELRIGKFRVFYDVILDGKFPVVKIKGVGHKEHNKLYIGGKEYKL